MTTGGPLLTNTWRVSSNTTSSTSSTEDRLTKLEKFMDQIIREKEIRDKNSFVQELYDQYKVGLVLAAGEDL